MQKQLHKHTYKPSRSICFAVTYPKVREIFAADFKDRIVHHLLVSYLEPYFEKRFIYSSFACRKEKGTLCATKYIQKCLGKVTKNYTKKVYYGQFDIKSFFTSIDKKILEEILVKNIQKGFKNNLQKELIWLTKVILNNDPTVNFTIKGDSNLLKQVPAHKSLFNVSKSKGLPIGNLTSQFFANVYLNELDQYVKRELKVKYYSRYVDDIVLISNSIKEIKQWRNKIDIFLKNRLKLSLHPKKDKFGSVYSGIDFVGYVIKPRYILSRNRVVGNLKNKLKLFNQGLLLVSQNQKQTVLPLHTPPSKEELSKILAMINSYYGHFRHVNCFNLRKEIYENHFGILKEYLEPLGQYSYFKLIK